MRLIVSGIGTDVGKTVTSAILVKALDADYYKPVQCGAPYDADTVAQLSFPRRRESRCSATILDSRLRGNDGAIIHPNAYCFELPASPHLAAEKAGVQIDPAKLAPPYTSRPLIIEGAGGVLVPFSHQHTWLDVASQWHASWIVVSRHYLGSINHTLLTIEAIKNRKQRIAAIVFNGKRHAPSEEAILSHARTSNFLRLDWHEAITPAHITRYAEQWKATLNNLQIG